MTHSPPPRPRPLRRARAVAMLVVRIAFRSVRRNWRHSLAALGTMAVGFVALALFQGYLDELLRSQLDLVYSRNMIGDILVRVPGGGSRESRIEPWRFHLGEREQQFLDGWVARHSTEVRARMRTIIVVGMAHSGGSAAEFWGIGHDVAEARLLRRAWDWNAWAGRPLREEDHGSAMLALGLGAILGCEVRPGEVVLDPETQRPRPVERPFDCKQTQLTLTAATSGARMNAAEVQVVGLTSTGSRDFDERLLFMPLAFAQELGDTHGISQYMIALSDPGAAPRLRADLRAELKAAGLHVEVLDWRDSESAEMLRRGLQLLGVYRGLVVTVILIIAGAAVLTTMMKTVRERTREVGTMRSLGYLGSHMRAMFAVEAAFLAVLAGLVGIAASALVTAVINSLHVMYKAGLMAEAIPLRIGYSVTAYAWGFVFLSTVAVVAALFAARGVTRMKITEALISFD